MNDDQIIPRGSPAIAPLSKAAVFSTRAVRKLCERVYQALETGDDWEIGRWADELTAALELVPENDQRRRDDYQAGREHVTNWERLTGRKPPGNVTELRALMTEAGFSPDFVASWQGVPSQIGPILAKKLSARDDEPSKWSKPITVAEGAKLYGRSNRTFVRWVTEGKIRAKKLDSKNYLIHVDDLPATKR